jgi:hypothetical protein
LIDSIDCVCGNADKSHDAKNDRASDLRCGKVMKGDELQPKCRGKIVVRQNQITESGIFLLCVNNAKKIKSRAK